jgi:hypothetical protein
MLETVGLSHYPWHRIVCLVNKYLKIWFWAFGTLIKVRYGLVLNIRGTIQGMSEDADRDTCLVGGPREDRIPDTVL